MTKSIIVNTETGEIAASFEGHVIDANELAATGKIGHEALNPVLHLGDVVTVVARCKVVAINHVDDEKRGLVRAHKLAIASGGLVEQADDVERILERMRADQDAANGTQALPLERY